MIKKTVTELEHLTCIGNSGVDIPKTKRHEQHEKGVVSRIASYIKKVFERSELM